MTSSARLYFSFRSPFSWLLIERLRRIAPDACDHLEFVPFWEPDVITREALERRDASIHYAPMSKAKHLYILQDTKRLAARMDLKIAWPVDLDPWWEPSHLGWLQARKLGSAEAFYAAVTKARWENGDDISKLGVIHRAAVTAGLDGDRIVAAVDDPAIRAEGVQCLVRAYEDDVFGVPYMRLGWHRFWGYDRLDDFLELLRPTLAEHPRFAPPTPAPESPVADIPNSLKALTGAYDTDTAGGCG